MKQIEDRNYQEDWNEPIYKKRYAEVDAEGCDVKRIPGKAKRPVCNKREGWSIGTNVSAGAIHRSLAKMCQDAAENKHHHADGTRGNQRQDGNRVNPIDHDAEQESSADKDGRKHQDLWSVGSISDPGAHGVTPS